MSSEHCQPLQIVVETEYPDGRRTRREAHAIRPSEVRELIDRGARSVRVLDSLGQVLEEVSSQAR